MPMPISRLPDNAKELTESIDISFLTQNLQEGFKSKKITASNHDAQLLYSIWEKGEHLKDGRIKLDNENKASLDDLMRLKRLGFIKSDDNNTVTFTDFGKKIVITMTLGENNKFLKNKSAKTYQEILSGMAGKKKMALAPVFSSSANLLVVKKS